jgi:hypothetical protein
LQGDVFDVALDRTKVWLKARKEQTGQC